MLVIETRCEIPKESHCQDEKYACLGTHENIEKANADFYWKSRVTLGIRANLTKIHLHNWFQAIKCFTQYSSSIAVYKLSQTFKQKKKSGSILVALSIFFAVMLLDVHAFLLG